MTTVALLVAPLHGHVNPALGTAAALTRRGHRVVMYLPEGFRAAVERTGAELRPVGAPPVPDWARSGDRLVRFATLPARLAHDSRTVLPTALAALAADPPDVLAYDQLCVWGRLAAAVSEQPAALLCTSYATGPRWSPWDQPAYAALPAVPAADAAWASTLDRLADRHGTPRLRLPDLLGAVEPVTVVFVPRVLHPAAAGFDDRYVFVGPALRPSAGDRAPDPSDGAERPLAYVSMGTLFGDWPELVPICAAAFANGRWRALVVVPGVEPTDQGPVRLRRWVDQPAVLDRAAVAVTHGGMGSVGEALWAGVPLVVIPQVPEQEVTADRVAALGVGIRLDRAATTAAALREAVDQVTGDPRVRRAVQRLSRAVRAGGGAPAAAAALLRRLEVAPT